jgi:hypothetical protein
LKLTIKAEDVSVLAAVADPIRLGGREAALEGQ